MSSAVGAGGTRRRPSVRRPVAARRAQRFVLSLLLFGCVLIGAGNRTGPRRHEVAITGFAYQPAVIRAAVGDTIVWSNRDVVPHTATDSAGAWDSRVLAQGQRWQMVVRKSGATTYTCTLHPSMTGKLIVP